MRVPIKIEPDRIKDSIVQVSFVSKYPYEVLIGYIYNVLTSNDFNYIAGPQPQIVNPRGVSINNVNLSPQFIDKENLVRIQLQQSNFLNFNITSKYIGWDVYSRIISKVLILLKDAQIIVAYTRIGIRYVSEFFNIDVLDKVKFSIDASFPGKKIESSTTNLKWVDDDFQIVLNIVSKLPLPLNNTKDFVSLIDVDVIKQGFQIVDVVELLTLIDLCHKKQKEVFFSLLTEDFLSELNPQYE